MSVFFKVEVSNKILFDRYETKDKLKELHDIADYLNLTHQIKDYESSGMKTHSIKIPEDAKIEITSLEHLLQVIAAVGGQVVIYDDYEGVYTLEVYNGYRE